MLAWWHLLAWRHLLSRSLLGFEWSAPLLWTKTRPPGSRHRQPGEATTSGSSACCRLLRQCSKVSQPAALHTALSLFLHLLASRSPAKSKRFKGHWASTEWKQRHKNSAHTHRPSPLDLAGHGCCNLPHKIKKHLHGRVGETRGWRQARYTDDGSHWLLKVAPTHTKTPPPLMSGSPKTFFSSIKKKHASVCVTTMTHPSCTEITSV